jgi:hypothetical protein
VPLAQGIIHSLRLIAEARDSAETVEDDPDTQYRLLPLLIFEKTREWTKLSFFGTTYTPGADSKVAKVNPGAISANGIFSSVWLASTDE